MKIALISSWSVYCGIATYTYHLAEKLLKENQDVRIFARDIIRGATYNTTLKKLPLKVIRCWSRKKEEDFEKLIKEVKRYNPDVVHVQSNIFDRIDGFKKLRNAFSGRIVITLHDLALPNAAQPWKVVYTERVKNFVDHFIVHDRLTKTCLIHLYKVKEKKISVIEHGTLLCPKIGKRAAREKIGYPQNIKLILSYGFFAIHKGTAEIIQSLPLIEEKVPNIKYIHLGKKRIKEKTKGGKIVLEYLQRCKKLVKKLNLQSQVKFIWQFSSEKEISYYLKAADVIVIYYDYPFSNLYASGIAHQAVAAGRPVITSDVSTFSEFPRNTLHKVPYALSYKLGKNNKIIVIKPFAPRENVKNLADTIIKVLSDKRLQKKLVQNSLLYAEKTSWEKTAKRHIKTYRKFLKHAKKK